MVFPGWTKQRSVYAFLHLIRMILHGFARLDEAASMRIALDPHDFAWFGWAGRSRVCIFTFDPHDFAGFC
jgi:hypothetical protein